MKKYVKNIILLVVIVIIASIFISCTENERARSFGGTMKVDIPKNTVVIGATWKQSDLWYLIKDTTTQKVQLIEIPKYGMYKGRVIFESK